MASRFSGGRDERFENLRLFLDFHGFGRIVEAFQFLSGELAARLERLRVLFTEDLSRLNDQLRRLGLEPIVVPDRRDPRVTT